MIKFYKTLLLFVLLFFLSGFSADDLEEVDPQTLQAAIGRGDAEAMNTMGLLYHTGRKVPVNMEEAMRHFRMAAEKGSALGAYNLAVCLEDSLSGSLFAEANQFFLKAAELGYPHAMRALALNYYHGRGTPQNPGKAYFWMLLASARATGDQFDSYAASRDKLSTWLSAAEIKDQQKNALDWINEKSARISQFTQLHQQRALVRRSNLPEPATSPLASEQTGEKKPELNGFDALYLLYENEQNRELADSLNQYD